ncbi:MAG: 3-oxoacyl-[acyl-carrier-protein] reductase [Bacteroidota bacterium]
MEKLLNGKTALVTGASKGIGKGIAEKLAQHGANVAFTYLSSVEKGLALEKELQQYGTKIKSYQSDASDFKSAETLINSVVADFGGLDIVVNNAGITRDGLLMRMSEENFNDVIRTNLNSVFNIVKSCQRQMLKQRSGSIINISSVVGLKGNAGQSNYAASKAGIIGFTKSIALELGSRNIRCNAIAPGFIETEMTAALTDETIKQWRESIPMKRGGSPDDIANCVVFLASDMAAYITGQVIQVDGGMLT